MIISEKDQSKHCNGVLLKLAFVCFSLAIILMPFNLLENMPHWFGEFSVEGAFYPLMAGIIFLGIDFLKRRQPSIPSHISFKLFVLFLIWALISGLANWPVISESFTRGRSGPNKLVLQYVVLLFTFCISLGGYQVYTRLGRDKSFVAVKFSALASFILCAVYSSIEMFYFAGNVWAENILLNINSLYRTNTLLWPTLRSVCGEPSWFGSYFAFAYPWLLACLFFSKKRGLIYLSLIIYSWAMVYLTFSRTAYYTLVAETLLFVLLVIATKTYLTRKTSFLLFIASAIIFIAVISYDPTLERINSKAKETIVSLVNQNTPHKISNVTRLGSAKTGINIGNGNPVFGVGIGQYAFHMPQYVPDWALESYEIIGYLDSSKTNLWIHTHCLFTRIYAETGAIGLLIWLGIWGSITFSLLKRLYKFTDNDEKLWLTLIFVCLAGVMMQGFNLGSFRFMGYWLLLPVIWVILSHEKFRN